jgi:bacterioferritin-associated ferredoxin
VTPDERIASLDKALGMMIALGEAALAGAPHGCGSFCPECREAINAMVAEAKRLRAAARAT